MLLSDAEIKILGGPIDEVKGLLDGLIANFIDVHTPTGEVFQKAETRVKEALEILRKRVMTGNDKLMNALEVINQITDEDESKKQWIAWGNSSDKLNLLCTILKSHGFIGCLYTGRTYEQEKKYKCNSWPNGKFCVVCGDGDIFWNEVIEHAPGPDRATSRMSEQSIKFLKDLSNEI
jgi:hypothetical protein